MTKIATLFILLIVSKFTLASVEKTKRIIGNDTRVRIDNTNYKSIHDSIGFIEIEKGLQFCTGTVIGPRHVLTAAHCLILDGKIVKKSVEFIPGLNGPIQTTKKPFGAFKAIKWTVIKAFIGSNRTEDDLALITFAENLPVQPVPIAAFPLERYSVHLTIAGYPEDKIVGTLWEGKEIKYYSFLYGHSEVHYVDTIHGQSGATVRTKVNNVESIVGVHSRGKKGYFGYYNEAKFFTPEVVKMLNKWMVD